VRERVGVGGQIKSVHRAHRLAPVDAEHKTAKSVRGLADKLLAPLNNNSASPLNITKLGDFCERIYFPHVKDSKRPSTLCGYRRIWNGYVKPRYESVWMREVRTRDVQAWLEEIARAHKLSKTTLRHVKHFLSGVFRYAAQQDYLDSGRNPVTLASIPNFAPNGEEGKAYSLEEIGRMLKVLPEPANTIVACAAYTGLRLGELRGLTWEAYSPGNRGRLAGFAFRDTLRVALSDRRTKNPKVQSSRPGGPTTSEKAWRIPPVERQSLEWTHICELVGKTARSGGALSPPDAGCAKACGDSVGRLAWIP
jgi:integrase